MATRPEVSGRRPAVRDYSSEADAYSIHEFCERHRISLQLYYKLRQKRLTPVEFRVGTRVLISKEAAAEWRREREAATAENSV
jgi:hypothetical protein